MSSQVFTGKLAYYAGTKDGDFEYLGFEAGRGGGILEFRTLVYPTAEFESECWLSLRKSVNSPKTIINRKNSNALFYAFGNIFEKSWFLMILKKNEAALSTRHVAGPGEA